MPTNLVSAISRFLTPDMVTKIALGQGLDRHSVEQAIAAGVPSILAGLTGVASTPEGAQRLSNVVSQQSPAALDEVKNMIGSSEQTAMADHGTSVLSTLLGGGMMKSLTSAISDFAGIRGGAGKSLLGLLAPVVLGTLGQHQRSAGLDANGLASLLHSQKETIGNALPAGFAHQLSGSGILESLGEGLRGTTAAASAAANRAGAAAGRAYTDGRTYATSSTPGASAQWPLWLLGLAALGGLLWYLTSGHEPERVATQPPQTPKVEEGRAVGTPQISVSELSKEVTNSFDGLRTTLQGITDPASAQAALPKLREMSAGLDKLTEATNKLPPEAQRTIASQVKSSAPAMNSMFERILSDPAVASIVRPIIEAVRNKLSSLASA